MVVLLSIVLLEVLYVHNYPYNVPSGVPTDNNLLIWHELTNSKGHSHAIYVYYTNFLINSTTETVRQNITGTNQTNWDIKLFELTGVSDAALLNIQVTNQSSNLISSMSVPSITPNAGSLVMGFGMWMQTGGSSRTWITEPLSEFNINLGSMQTKGTLISGDSHYAIAAYYPNWNMSSTTAPMIPSGGSTVNWNELVIAIPASGSSSVTSNSINVLIPLFCLGISLILTLGGRKSDDWAEILYVCSTVFGILTLAYFATFSTLSFGSFGTFPIWIFLVAYVFVAFMLPIVWLLKKVI